MQENQVGVKLNGTHQLLAYADDERIIKELLERKLGLLYRKTELTAVLTRCDDRATPLFAKVDINFSNQLWALSRYNWLAD
jgi:hypothetical protein